jgi:hypothetical protein
VISALDVSIVITSSTFLSNYLSKTSCTAETLPKYRGGVATLYLSEITLRGNTFANNSAGENECSGGGAISILGGTVRIGSNNNFFNNTAGYGGELSAMIDTAILFMGHGNTFARNRASFGGAVHGDMLEYFRAATYHAVYQENIATRDGGALHLLDTPEVAFSDRTLFVRNLALLGNGGALFAKRSALELRYVDADYGVRVDSNSAPEGGGGFLFWIGTQPQMQSSAMPSSGGWAKWGPVIATPPERVHVMSPELEGSYPGKLLPSLGVSLSDFYGQRARLGSEADSALSVSERDTITASVDGASLNGRVIVPLVDGWANFTNLELHSLPGTYLLHFSFVSRSTSSIVVEASFSFRLEECPDGKGLDARLMSCEDCAPGSYRNGSSRSRVCGLCSRGTYQWHAGASKCEPCDVGSVSVDGAATCQMCLNGYIAGVSHVNTM